MGIRALLFTCLFVWPLATAEAVEQFPFVGVITGNSVNVRAGQSTNFDSVLQMDKGEKLVVLERVFSWYKIRLPQKAQCYISAEFVRTQRGEIGEVTGRRVNLRARPDLTSSQMGQLRKGQLVRKVAEKDGWWQIEPMEGIYGWITADFVEYESSDVPPARVVTLPPPPKPQVVRKPVPTPKKETSSKDENKIEVAGRLEDLGRLLPDYDIHYKLIIDGETAYYLIGPRRIFDPFINLKVLIRGKRKPDPEGQYPVPVILVSKVNLILNN